MFEQCLHTWHLEAVGAPLHTPSSDLLPVRRADGQPAILKRARAPEERAGAALMQWWNGDGAARVLARSGDVLLLERATGAGDLLAAAMHDAAGDDEASRILCAALDRLHAPRPSAPPPLQPLDAWFKALRCQAATHGGVLAECASIADAVLAAPHDVLPLHGDCHHRNVLDFGARGWLAIDPKDRCGERGFDHAQILCNPDLPHAADGERFRRQLHVVADAARLDPDRLARWTAARAALSAVWFMEDADAAAVAHTLAIARTALAWIAGNTAA